jgi:signal transduction histidine kinase
MYEGGVKINERTGKVIRIAGLVVPVFLTLYGILIQYGLVNNTHYVSDGVFFAIVIPWMLLAGLQYLFSAKSKIESGIRLALYHIFTALYIILVSGFATPFIIAWILLFVAAYGYFSHTGIRMSIFILVTTMLADIFVHIGDTSTLLTDILVVTSVLIVGGTGISIGQVQELDGAELLRSRAKEALQRDRILTIVNNLSNAVLSTDKDGIVRVYNASSLNLLDTNNSLNGKFINDILTLTDTTDEKIDVFKALKESRSTVVRDDLTMSITGETLRLEVTFSPIRSNFTKSSKSSSEDGYIIILRDITKAKSLEEERDEFISVVSHELRTPITVVEGTISNVQLMLERGDVAHGILVEGMATAHEQVVYLSRMVNDLSTLSRAERGVADEKELINVGDIVADLYKDYHPQAVKKKLLFDLDVDTSLGNVLASRLYLKELLQNFITNALKYTKEGTVTLSVHRKADTITFTVKDTGIGISKSDQAKVFNKFYRSEDYRTRETGGTGLGLYVAIKLAKKLGTKIDLTSRLNYGSSFSFHLPVEK